jgi:WD40 repeat protein
VLADASTTGHVLLWNVTRPSHPHLLATVGGFNGYAYTVSFTPNGRTLIAAGADRTVRMWNIANPGRPRPIGGPLTGPTSSIYDIAVSPNGSRLAAATTDGSVWLWDIANPVNPDLVADLTGSTSELYAVSFQPHSNTLIAGGSDQQLHIWDDNPADLSDRICKLAGTPLTRSEWSQYVETSGYHPPCR